MTVPLPNPLNITETALLAILMFFFAIWGWRHGLNAVVLAGAFILVADLFSEPITKFVAGIVNFVYAVFALFTKGQFSTQNLSAALSGTSLIIKVPVNPSNPEDAGYAVLSILLFVVISFFAFNYADKKVRGKETFLESLFGFIGGAALGFVAVTYVLDKLVKFPQTVVVQPSEVPQVKVSANLLVVIVVVLIVFGYGRIRSTRKK